MTATLFTFLGRVARTEKGTYRSAVYRFADGDVTEPVAFLGWPLARRTRPDRLVVLGTAGSMWDHLFEGDLDFGSEAEQARLALLDPVERRQVTQPHLEPLAPMLGARIGCEVRLALIPYCRDEAEQAGLLAVIAEHVAAGDTVDLDVTHGFRHLPMLSLLAALYLRRVRGAHVRHIWYGAFDPDTGEAPMHELAGMLRIADWLEALAVYDHCGDYGVFGPLAGPAGRWLEKAAFHERATSVSRAREALTAWASSDAPLPPERPEAQLFAPALHQRLEWRRLDARDVQEAALARRYLAEGDFLRAAIFAQEAVISAEVKAQGRRVDDTDARNEARDFLNEHEPRFPVLGRFRNSLAHGTRSRDPRVSSAFDSPERLAAALGDLFEALLPATGVSRSR